MSMLIGAGNALQNFGQQLGQSFIDADVRKRQEEQRAFENLMAKKKFDLDVSQQAQQQANLEKERVFKLIGSLPGRETEVGGDMGRGLLQRGGPDMGMFIKQSPHELATRSLGPDVRGEGPMQPGAQPDSFRIQRPESDAYARAALASQDKALDRDVRRENSLRRLQTSNAATAARMQIAQMGDATRQNIATQQLNQLASQFAQRMEHVSDQDELAWQRADQMFLQEWQQMQANPLLLPQAGAVRPRVERTPPGGKGKTTKTVDVVDEILAGMPEFK